MTMKQAIYQIKVEGYLDPCRAEWFDGWEITQQEDRSTLLTSSTIDQPVLHGLLNKIRDLNLAIISVQRIEDSKGGTYERATR